MSLRKEFAFTRLKPFLALLITLLLTAYQLWRIIAFASIYGGIEHDGGWTLGAARSLAERGEYTYMISTIVDPNVSAGINVDNKFDIQASDGRVWFRTSASIGPASVVPEAVVLKIFGFGFWAIRTGPLIFYTLFLLLAAYILYQLAGLGAVVLFHAFLFFYPHLSIFLSYQGLGEVPSMFYQLGAFLAWAIVVKRQERRLWPFWVVGLLAGLAVNAKLLAFLSVSGILAWAGFLWLFGQKKMRFVEWLSLAGGVVLVQVGWELVQMVILTRLTNFGTYLRHAQQRWIGFLDEGSGLRLRTESGPEFIWRKILALKEITHPETAVMVCVVIGLLLGGFMLFWLWGKDQRRDLLAPLWLGWLANTVWFIGLAKTSWPRHYWFGLILAVILLCSLSVTLMQAGWPKAQDNLNRLTRSTALALGLLLLALMSWGFASQPYVRSFYLPDEIVGYWQQKRANNNYLATLPWLIVPSSAQGEVIDYIKSLPPEANVYYPAARKGADIAVLTGRIQYPLNRRGYPGVEPNPADVLLIPPAVISSWSHDPTMWQALQAQVQQACPEPEVKNDFYVICKVEKLHSNGSEN